MPTKKELTLTEKLVEIQEKLKAPKGQFNKFANFAYRSCEDILGAVKPLLAERGIAIRLNDKLVQIGERYYVKATAGLIDAEGREMSTTAYAREEENKKGMDGSQITGTASSYARKYALNGLFAIDDGKDADSVNLPAAPVKPAKGAEPEDWFDTNNGEHKKILVETQTSTKEVGKNLVAEIRKIFKVSKANAAKIESWNPNTAPPPKPAEPAEPKKAVEKAWDKV